MHHSDFARCIDSRRLFVEGLCCTSRALWPSGSMRKNFSTIKRRFNNVYKECQKLSSMVSWIVSRKSYEELMSTLLSVAKNRTISDCLQSEVFNWQAGLPYDIYVCSVLARGPLRDRHEHDRGWPQWAGLKVSNILLSFSISYATLYQNQSALQTAWYDHFLFPYIT